MSRNYLFFLINVDLGMSLCLISFILVVVDLAVLGFVVAMLDVLAIDDDCLILPLLKLEALRSLYLLHLYLKVFIVLTTSFLLFPANFGLTSVL